MIGAFRGTARALRRGNAIECSTQVRFNHVFRRSPSGIAAIENLNQTIEDGGFMTIEKIVKTVDYGKAALQRLATGVKKSATGKIRFVGARSANYVL
jgi:ABC-type ATPase involved in cell division